MYRFVSLSLLCFLFFSFSVSSQTSSDGYESWLDSIENEEDRKILGETIQRFRYDPLDLNVATAEELSLIPFFDEYFIRHFLLYRSRRGRLDSVYEIKGVPGVPTYYLPLIESLVCVRPLSSSSSSTARRSDIYMGVDNDLGRWTGERAAFALKYSTFSSRGWSGCFVAEKDRGESWRPLREGVTDYLSASLAYTPVRPSVLTHLVLGDLRLTTGSGLLYGMDLSYYTSVESGASLSTARKGIVRPHRSFREGGYLRGAGFTLKEKELSLTFVAGIHPLDARIESDSIRTLYTTGLHRTDLQKRYRRTARADVAGGYVAWQRGYTRCGLSLETSRYVSAQGRQLLSPSPLFRKGWQTQTSIDARWVGSSLEAEGECLFSLSERVLRAGMLRVSYRDDYLGTFSLGVRHMGQGYATLFGNPDTHFSTARNERGIYLDCRGDISYSLRGRIYLDRFRSICPDPRRKNRKGMLLLATLEHNTNCDHSFVRYRLRRYDAYRAHSFRIDYRRAWSSVLDSRMGTTFCYSSSLLPSYSVYTSVRGKYPLFQVQGALQYFRVPTGGIPLRSLYVYLPYHYSCAPLYGTGMRTTLQASYRIHESWKVSGRFTTSLYRHAPSTLPGTSLEITLVGSLRANT